MVVLWQYVNSTPSIYIMCVGNIMRIRWFSSLTMVSRFGTLTRETEYHMTKYVP